MTYNEEKTIYNLVDTIHGELNRMCVTHELSELDSMHNYAKQNIDKLSKVIYDIRFKETGG